MTTSFSETLPRSLKSEQTKSEQTLAAIVMAGLHIAKQQGLQAVSLTSVAKAVGVSKAGVALRAGSLQQLQFLVLDEYEALFLRTVFQPAMAQPRGLPRLDALMNLWLRQCKDRDVLIGSLYGMAAFEVDDAHRALRERLLQGFRAWQDTIERCIVQAVELKHLRPDTDPEQLVFEIFGLMVSFSYAERLSPNAKAFERAGAAYARLIFPYRRITT